MPIFKVIGLATATKPQQTTNHHHHATCPLEKPLNHKPTNPLNQKTNRPIFLVPTQSKSDLHRTHVIKTPTEWSSRQSKPDLHGMLEPTRSKPHWNETYAIKTQSPYIYADKNFDLHRTHANQNSIGTHPISFRRSKPHRNPPKIKTHLTTPIPTHDLTTTHTPHDELHAKRPKHPQWQVLNERRSEEKVT